MERDTEMLTCDAYNNDPVRVRRVARTMPSYEAFEKVSVLLKAIAAPVRVRILYALTVEPLCVCELATLLAMSLPAVSHHLRVLTLGGLLKSHKEGKFVCYYISDVQLTETLIALISPEKRSL